MKIIIAGSRSITSMDQLHLAIHLANFNITEVVSGTANGVDKLGEQWAKLHKIPIMQFPAEWDKYAKRAGYLRNEQMGDYADGLISVWDGASKGTQNMINIIKRLRKPHYIHVVNTQVQQPSKVMRVSL